MCTANTYSESAMKGLTIQSDGPNPCGRWIRNAIQSITEQQMLLGLSDGIDSTVSHLKKLGCLENQSLLQLTNISSHDMTR